MSSCVLRKTHAERGPQKKVSLYFQRQENIVRKSFNSAVALIIDINNGLPGHVEHFSTRDSHKSELREPCGTIQSYWVLEPSTKRSCSKTLDW